MNAKLSIDLSKLTENARNVTAQCKACGISVMGVTKGVSGSLPVARAMVNGGVEYLADARLRNLKKLKSLDVPKVLLRVPALSEVAELVEYADISLNSEIRTIERIAEEAVKAGKVHKLILMVDIGEYREGVLPEEIIPTVERINRLEGVRLYGLGTTLTCIHGVIPDETNLGELVEIAKQIEVQFKLTLPVISGGNSSSYYLVQNGSIPRQITNLRLGETILLGRETAYGNQIEDLNRDVFVFRAEIVELKRKPSKPKGNIGMDAFGKIPKFADKGFRQRALLSAGIQDVVPEYLIPADPAVEIVGGSSDYLVVDLTDCSKEYTLGDYISFYLTYGGIVQLCTSEYVVKEFVE